MGLILELPEADFRATATATAATAVATPTTTATANATSRPRAFSSGAFGFATVVWEVSPSGTEAATTSWSFAFELLDQASLALALEGLGLLLGVMGFSFGVLGFSSGVWAVFLALGCQLWGFWTLALESWALARGSSAAS